jgi:L-lactate dehydrogenase complex protein LldG
MNAPIQSRLLILDRIRSAAARSTNGPGAEAPQSYIRQGKLDNAARVQLMVDRLREYDAEVVECVPEQLVACIKDRLRSSGRRKFVAPAGLPVEWAPFGFEWMIDRRLEHEEIEQCEGVVTGAFAGIADSGTIVLHHSASEGRRVITLLPDWHLCILPTSRVVETLPEYFDLCSKPPALATYISGPSATADIEMTRIKGVHGPRFLNVILVHSGGREQAAERP